METKKLYRSRTNKMVAGVCEGLAKYFKVDVVFIRLIFVLFTIWSCVFPFALLYLILWIITPLEPEVIKPEPVKPEPEPEPEPQPDPEPQSDPEPEPQPNDSNSETIKSE